MTWQEVEEVTAQGSLATQEERRRRYRIVTRVPTLTSLIDIVFLMLVFFMVTATIAPKEYQLGASAPSPSANGAQEQVSLELLDPAKMAVEIEVSGTEDAFSMALNGRELTSLQQLYDLLRELSKSEDLPGTERLRARIRGSDTVRYKYVLYVLNTVHRVGFEDITLESK